MDSLFLLLVPIFLSEAGSTDRLINTYKIHKVREIVVSYIFTYGVLLCITVSILFQKDIMISLLLFLQLDIARIIVFFTREPILEEPNLKILNSIHTKIFAAIIFVGISLAVISFL